MLGPGALKLCNEVYLEPPGRVDEGCVIAGGACLVGVDDNWLGAVAALLQADGQCVDGGLHVGVLRIHQDPRIALAHPQPLQQPPNHPTYPLFLVDVTIPDQCSLCIQ